MPEVKDKKIYSPVWVEPDFHHLLKVHCAQTGQTIHDFASKWLARGMKKDRENKGMK